MRTTLDIDDDLILAAKEIARHQGGTAGQVISRLLRTALTAPAPAAKRRATGVAGFQPFAAKPGVVVTLEQVNALRDAEGL